MDKDMLFLKELQQTLKSQEIDGQASPRFWVLRQYEYVPTRECYMDKYLYTFSDGDLSEFDTTDELIEFLSDNDIGSQELLDHIEPMRIYDAFEYICRNHNDNGFFNITPVQIVAKTIPNTMFITKEDAKQHIKLNKHHYNDTVHTYAMTAWRSPLVKRLWKILECTDWDNINN